MGEAGDCSHKLGKWVPRDRSTHHLQRPGVFWSEGGTFGSAVDEKAGFILGCT